MLRHRNRGYTIEIDLPKEYGYQDYIAECTYRYDKKTEKYILSMWLKKRGFDDKFKIDSQEVDTQPVSGTKETITQNVCQIVEYACSSGFFDHYIDRLEYTYQCFERGNELFEKERLNGDS